MATVVVTFFLFVRFYICKMDADCKKLGRDWSLSSSLLERGDRFGMDTQRFEEILAEISKGYDNIRNSFDNVKIAEILEEMLTEWARAALESEAAPNFAEVAVVLQHCAALYGRKVDFLHQHVLAVCESLAAAAPAPEPRARRRRASPVPGDFAHIAVAASAGACRAAEPPRPPPVLPRMYAELEPRALAPGDWPLTDLAGEPVGAPADYHVAWRLQDGWLVDELEPAAGSAGGALRGLSLVELEAALAARAPPDPPPEPAPEPRPESAPSAPPTPPLSPPPEPRLSPALTPSPAVEALRPKRKRRSSLRIEDIPAGPLKMFVSDAVAARRCEFRPAAAWVERVLEMRARRVLAARCALAPAPASFRGFEDAHPDAGGFAGWAASEGAAAAALAARASRRLSGLEEDDDGFFERSSNSSFDSTRTATDIFALPEAEAAWSAGVVARAAAEEARGGVDVRALGAALLAALPAGAPLPFAELLARAARRPPDVSRLLLTALFLANSGNVEVVPAAPPAPGDFSLALLSTDESLFAAAADAPPA